MQFKVGDIVRIDDSKFEDMGEKDWEDWELIKKVPTFPILEISKVYEDSQFPYYINHFKGDMAFRADEVVNAGKMNIIEDDILL